MPFKLKIQRRTAGRFCLAVLLLTAIVAVCVPWHRVAVWTLLRCLNCGSGHISGQVRAEAALRLGSMEADPKIVVPALLPHLRDKDMKVREMTALSLGHIHQYPEQAVPALLAVADSETAESLAPLYAVYAIGCFGTNARPWAPNLAQMIESNRFGYWSGNALNALQKIDPAAAKPFLDERKSPNSKARLTSILPSVSDFAKRLNLPIQLPITPDHVSRFVVVPGQAALWLTNNYWFALEDGIVRGFRSPDDWFTMAEEYWDHLERYVGRDNMTTNEAIELARNSFRKLGYKPEVFHVNEPPTTFVGSHDNKQLGHIPYCRVQWESPPLRNHAELDKSFHIYFDIDMQRRQVVAMSLISRRFQAPGLKTEAQTNVQPELETQHLKPPNLEMFTRTNAAPHIAPPAGWLHKN